MDDNQNRSQKDAEYSTSAGAGEEREDTATESQSTQKAEQAQAGIRVTPFVDHTPPPVLIGNGSVIIETDMDFDRRDTTGAAAHKFRHMFRSNRPILGLRILDDAGNTIFLEPDAAGFSVKVWWNRGVATEQILIDAHTLSIEADRDLGRGTTISHPPGNTTVRRIKQFTHPGTTGRHIEKVEVVKNGTTRFSNDSERIYQIMIWDTAGRLIR
jgi:hypothetical protein